ncbi:hypothetical protein LXA43DRAFT_1064075 [Ganoderma leucocontextum]|nr:hypothetical protein LXA43DRAFT_1064075 [Ganoderma leucocontextum]
MHGTDNDADILALSRRLSPPDGDMSDPDFHLDIFYTARHIADHHPNPSTAPPLPVLLYAIRNILQPSLLLDQIPELLALVVHLEIFRTNTIENIHRLLQRDKSFPRNNSPSVRLLSHQHRALLHSLASPKQLSATRTIYRKIIHGSCLLHIHHLWSNYDPQLPNSPSPLEYLIDYFPAFAQRDQAAANQCQAALINWPWHYNLSQDELRENDKKGQEAANFLVAASQYLDDPDRYCLEKGFQVRQSFDTILPPPSQDDTVHAITKYMTAVSQAAAALEAILDDGSED